MMKSNNVLNQKYPHIYRNKTIWELMKLSAAVMGIEFAYSAETAFVSPILLELGVDHDKLIAMWAISPVLGFFLGPLLGMFSDKCTMKMGRRRPFILFLSIGLLVGVLLVPCGKNIGEYFGDNPNVKVSTPTIAIITTVIGTIFMDLNADICQSPVRAYLLEVTTPADYNKGLSMFTLMGGIGGFVGYTFGAIDWNTIVIGTWMGGNIKFIFLSVAIVFVIGIVMTVASFKEVPLNEIRAAEEPICIIEDIKLDVLHNKNTDLEKDNINNNGENLASFKDYLKSIVCMPKSMIILYIVHLLTWMSHLSYVLYFTDFVGETVYEGDASAINGSIESEIYDEGVRFGCWGLAVYALSCAGYSFVIDFLIKKFKLKTVYIGAFVLYAAGMALMATIRTKIVVLVSSITAGIEYSTLFNIPYLIIGRYHQKGNNDTIESTYSKRGIGTDMAIIGSTVFVGQLTLSLGLSAAIKAIGTISITIWAASALSALAAIAATQIIYLDL